MAVLLLGVCARAPAAPHWVALTGDDPGPPVVQVVTDGSRETVLRITIPGYFSQNAAPDGAALWSLPGWSWVWEHGRPQVPRIAVDLVIAGVGDVAVDVLAQDAHTRPVPQYLSAIVARHGQTPGEVAPAARAAEAGPFPEAVVACGEPFILRQVRGVTLTVHPFQYDAAKAQMRVTTQLVVRVRTTGEGGRNVLQAATPAGDSAVFVDTYRSRFANYRARAATTDYVPEVGRMLVIAYDAYYDAALPFVHWKRQKGIPTEMVPLSAIGTNASAVQAFIQATYASNGVTYVQLVGDADQVPSLPGTKGIMTTAPPAAADPLYVLLAGDDYYADAFIARFPGRTEAQISNMVQRCIRYEQSPATNETWYHEACGVASTLLAGGVRDYERMELIRGVLTNFTYTHVDQIYDPSGTRDALVAALNAGRSLVNYQGHGTATFLTTPPQQLKLQDVLGLGNNNRLPFVHIVGCRSGAFQNVAVCMADTWITAGAVGGARGGVSVFASTHDQWELPPTTGQAKCMDLLVSRQFQTLGALCFNSVMHAVSLHTEPNPDPPGTKGEELYEQSHLLGDGTLVPWTDTPRPMVVQHAGLRYAGQAAYAVHVPEVAGALCALYDAATHTLVGAGYTDLNGMASVPVTLPGDAPLTLTVTAFNRVPYITTIVAADGPMLQVR